MSKPRCWTIHPLRDSFCPQGVLLEGPHPVEAGLKVIEYSAYESMKLQKDFILAYLNPKDTSFKNMILDFVSLDKLKQDRLIDLTECLLKIQEACK